MPKEVHAELDRKMQATIEALKQDLSGLRTGRATPTLLERINVDYYGAQTPLLQLALISVTDPRQLLVKPHDKSVAAQVANTISKSDLGVQATLEGDSIRVSIPALNEERRKEMVKLAGRKTEEYKITMRNIRREANDQLKRLEKDGGMTKDELKREEEIVQKTTDRYINETDQLRDAKEAEIMQV